MAVEAELPLAQHLENLSDDREEWSLDSDMRLFDALKHFSASVVERSQAVETKIDSLCSRTVQTDVRLRNTFNEFLMLCNTQARGDARAVRRRRDARTARTARGFSL